MNYLRLLHFASRCLGWLMKRCSHDGRVWAELADIDGRISFRQIDYAKRVQKASGWEPVEITVPRVTWTSGNWITNTATTATTTATLTAVPRDHRR